MPIEFSPRAARVAPPQQLDAFSDEREEATRRIRAEMAASAAAQVLPVYLRPSDADLVAVVAAAYGAPRELAATWLAAFGKK